MKHKKFSRKKDWERENAFLLIYLFTFLPLPTSPLIGPVKWRSLLCMTILGSFSSNSLGYCTKPSPTVCGITFSLCLKSGKAAALHRDLRKM